MEIRTKIISTTLDRDLIDKWWIDAVNQIIKKGHKVLHCGYFTEPNLSDDNNNYKKITTR